VTTHFGEKGQVSAELIIVIAAVLAVALIFVTQLGETAKKGSAELSNKSDEVLAAIRKI
jgi:uncharacterized protein (UPF0333 family)